MNKETLNFLEMTKQQQIELLQKGLSKSLAEKKRLQRKFWSANDEDRYPIHLKLNTLQKQIDSAKDFLERI